MNLPRTGTSARTLRAALFATILITLSTTLLSLAAPARAADAEYTGKLDPQLVIDESDYDRIIFKPLRDRAKLKLAAPLEEGATISAGRLYDPPRDKTAILAVLVEPADDTPYLLADLNSDNTISDAERLPLTRDEEDSPYILAATLTLPLEKSLFGKFPLKIKYYKGVKWSDMREGERMVFQSKAAFASGKVKVNDRDVLVRYGFNPASGKISATRGWLGVDGDGDGEILMDRLSPEAAQAQDETVVFRVGTDYVSTKRVDVDKNQITLRAHPASDYKRTELRVGAELPDFEFTDFKGKKRRFSEFRGKYVLLDFWASWCGPCREELPYLRHAYQKFQARDFEILGLNNDSEIAPVKAWLKDNNLLWTQATPDSIRDVMKRLRVQVFPTTILVGPEGKIISLGQRNTDQPELRGKELIASLDRILEP